MSPLERTAFSTAANMIITGVHTSQSQGITAWKKTEQQYEMCLQGLQDTQNVLLEQNRVLQQAVVTLEATNNEKAALQAAKIQTLSALRDNLRQELTAVELRVAQRQAELNTLNATLIVPKASTEGQQSLWCQQWL